MSQRDVIVLAFDLYGTLLDTASIRDKLAEQFGADEGHALALTFRKHQLEYTWRHNSMGFYEPFANVTKKALHNALQDHGKELSDEQIEGVMRANDSLSAFPDVAPALEAIAGETGIKCVVFSNGDPDMVRNSVRNSPDLAPHAGVFADLISVADVKKYKPDPDVYRWLAWKVGKDDKSERGMAQVWLVSGNPFDVVGARATGMQAAWVDRTGKGWADRQIDGERGRPTAVVKGLGEVVAIAREHKASGWIPESKGEDAARFASWGR